MTLQELGGGVYDYAQGSTPSGAEAGETWLDTSVNPPQGKAYDGSSWLAVESVQKILNNVDTAVSSRSSHSDPDPNGYIDMAISNAGGGVDWASKTPKAFVVDGSKNSVSGSGYFLGATNTIVSGDAEIILTIDGTTKINDRYFEEASLSTIFRFESSFSLEETNFSDVLAWYVLD